METGLQIKKYAFLTLLIAVVIFSVVMAFIIYRYYGVLARGITGFVMLYLLFLNGIQTDVSINAMLSDLKKGKYLIWALIDPLISYWATLQIYEMILFFTKR